MFVPCCPLGAAEAGLVFVEAVIGDRDVGPIPARPVVALVTSHEQDRPARLFEREQHPDLGPARGPRPELPGHSDNDSIIVKRSAGNLPSLGGSSRGDSRAGLRSATSASPSEKCSRRSRTRRTAATATRSTMIPSINSSIWPPMVRRYAEAVPPSLFRGTGCRQPDQSVGVD